jgi:hypothetical protein
MKAPAIIVSLSLSLAALLATPAAAQPEVTALQKAKLLEKSCYVIDASLDEVTQAYNKGCRYMRWFAYPMIHDVDAQGNGHLPMVLEENLTRLADAAKQIPSTAMDPARLEFALPESVSSEVNQLVLSPGEVTSLQKLGDSGRGADRIGIASSLNTDFRFDYQKVKVPTEGDHVWNDPASTILTSVPSLDTAQGRLYQALLMLRASARGQGKVAFYIAQPQRKIKTGDSPGNAATLARAIRDLRYLKPGVMIGASATQGILPDGTPLNQYLDWAKAVIDIDYYNVLMRRKRVVLVHGGSPVPCQTSGNDDVLLPKGAANSICMLDINKTGREYFACPSTSPNCGNRAGVSIENENPYQLPLLLELDGYTFCTNQDLPSVSKKAVAYTPNTQGATSNCYPEVRRRLNTTMVFVRSPAAVRQRFIRYMSAVTALLRKRTDHPPVYFPMPVVLDQNQRFLVARNAFQTGNAPAWAEQLTLVKVCPATPDSPGLPDPSPDPSNWLVTFLEYHAQACGDLDTIGSVLAGQ